MESRISNWIPEAARGIGHFKMATFGHLSGIVDKALHMAKFKFTIIASCAQDPISMNQNLRFYLDDIKY